MEDKTFELITQMYSELKEFRKETNEFRKETNDRLTKLETVIEIEIKPDMKAALEGYQMVYEKQQEHDKLLDAINNKLEKQDVEITVIKGGKEKMAK